MNTFKSILKGLRLLKDISKVSPMRVPLELISVLLTVMNSMVVRMLLVKWILDEVVKGNYSFTLMLIAFSAGLDFLLSAFDSWMNDCYRPKDSVRLHMHLHKELYVRASKVEFSLYDNPTYYNDFLMAAKNIDTTAAELLDSLRNFLITVLELFISGGLIIYEFVGLLPIVLIPSTIYMVIMGVNAKLRVDLNEVRNPELKKIDYVKRTFFKKNTALDIRTTNLKLLLLKLLNNGADEAVNKTKKITDKRLMLSTIQGFAFYFQYVAVLVVLAWRALTLKDISVGDFSVLVASADTLANNWRFFGRIAGNLAEYGLYSKRYYDFLSAKTDEIKVKETETFKGICIKDVSFTYPGNEKNVFSNLNMDIDNNKKVAIVGPNGAGKTTLINLLLNFYTPDKGSITINERVLEKSDRLAFSLIFQDSKLYPFTVSENLLLRSPDCKEDIEKIEKVLKKVGLFEKIGKLPHGINTQVTKEFDNEGVVFSGGEAQRLMLARALLNKRAVYIFDEPTAAQDPKAESELNKLFTDVSEDKTIIIITHRLSTLSGMDKIYLIDGGEVIESGSHNELMAIGGRYADMYKKQVKLYSL